jgi:hypothetical protein
MKISLVAILWHFKREAEITVILRALGSKKNRKKYMYKEITEHVILNEWYKGMLYFV